MVRIRKLKDISSYIGEQNGRDVQKFSRNMQGNFVLSHKRLDFIDRVGA